MEGASGFGISSRITDLGVVVCSCSVGRVTSGSSGLFG